MSLVFYYGFPRRPVRGSVLLVVYSVLVRILPPFPSSLPPFYSTRVRVPHSLDIVVVLPWIEKVPHAALRDKLQLHALGTNVT